MKTGWLKRQQTWAAAAIVIACSLAVPAKALSETLTDALISAYQTSNLLEQNRALLRAADEDVVQAGSALKPVISFVGDLGFQAPRSLNPGEPWVATATLSASLTLYDHGETKYAVDAAKETVLGLRGALLQVEQSVFLNTVSAYMEMIRTAQLVSISQNNVRVITQELRAARDRFQVGEVTRTDVAIAEARLAAARGNLAAAQGDLEIARENYKAIVGHYPGNLRWPNNPPLSKRSEAEAKAFAVRNHPAIEEAQRNVNAAEANILRAEAAFGPTVAGTSSLRITEGFQDTFSVGVSLTQPIYSGGALRSVKRQAVANRDAARALLLQSAIDVKQNVGIAWANLSVAAARTQASQREVRASQVAFEGVREEAKFGSRTTLDVLNAEQDLLDARSNLITAQTQQYVAVYQLFSGMGLLTSQHLGLGIPTYDPIEYYRYAASQDGFVAVSRQGQALDRVLQAIKP